MSWSNISETLESLFSLERLGVKMGLEHTEKLLSTLGNPQKNLNLVHIAGTNGKGSTSSHIECVLRGLGKKVGLYTSPHLVSFNERIRVNGISITDQEIESFLKQSWTNINKIKSTFFETTTAMALSHFNLRDVDIAIIETGLGGRLDSTNIIDPSLTIITSVSMDHMEILGNTIEAISFEKAGIIKKGVPLITFEQNKAVMQVLYDMAKQKNTDIQIVHPPQNIKVNSSNTQFKLGKTEYKTALLGKHQAQNASLAIAALKVIEPKISNESINSSFSQLRWAGRLEMLSPHIYYDVAHNFSGVKVMVNFFLEHYPDKSLYGLFALKGDKGSDLVFKILLQNFDRLLVTTDKEGLLMPELKLSQKLNKNGVSNLPMRSVKDGISEIKKLIKNNGIGIIFGTHYIAKEVYKEFDLSFDRGLI